jgi:hypothetical protein
MRLTQPTLLLQAIRVNELQSLNIFKVGRIAGNQSQVGYAVRTLSMNCTMDSPTHFGMCSAPYYYDRTADQL